MKIFYRYRALGGKATRNIETSESRYFSEEELSELAEEKINEDQVMMCFKAYRSKNWSVQFD